MATKAKKATFQAVTPTKSTGVFPGLNQKAKTPVPLMTLQHKSPVNALGQTSNGAPTLASTKAEMEKPPPKTPEQIRQEAAARILGSQEWADAQQKNQAAYDRGLSFLTEQGERDKRDFETSLERLAKVTGQSKKQTLRNANKQGLLYSGALRTREGEIEANRVEQESDMRRAFDDREADRNRSRDDLAAALKDSNDSDLNALIESAVEKALNAAVAEDTGSKISSLEEIIQQLLGGGQSAKPTSPTAKKPTPAKTVQNLNLSKLMRI